jgi:hypothetical protein
MLNPVWAMFPFYVLSDNPEQVEACVIIIERQLKNIGDMLVGDDQRMSAGHRVPIADRKRVFILHDYFGVRFPEGTSVLQHRRSSYAIG